MKVTYFGTTTLLFDDGIDQILFDAHFTRPSLLDVGFKKIQTNTNIIDTLFSLHTIDRLQAVFVSHSHHDHVMDAPYVCNKTDCHLYGSSSSLNVARGENVKEDRLHLFVPNKEIQIGKFKITVIPSLHSKAKWYNNDVGQTIDAPIHQPAKKKEYKEGGSYDFIIKHQDKTYVIRPSYNYIKNQFEDMHIDVLFLGIGGLSKDTDTNRQSFYHETIERLHPNTVIPIHYDNFFSPLDVPAKGMPQYMEDTDASLYEMVTYCEKQQISFIVQLPRTFIEI